jgi:hypothetical protein
MAQKKRHKLRGETARPVPTRSWTNDKHQLEGLENFKKNMPIDPKDPERQRCVNDPQHAKEMFALWGEFYLQGEGPFPNLDPIPTTTVFNVYEPTTERKTGRNRDKEVVLILDDPNVDRESTDYTWRCTYTPYKVVGLESKPSIPSEGNRRLKLEIDF